MDRATFREIVGSYDYGRVVFADEAPLVKNAVVLEPVGERWRVFRTSKRAEPKPETVEQFATEAEALAHMMATLQQARAVQQLSAHDRRIAGLDAPAAVRRLRACVEELWTFLAEHDLGRWAGTLAALRQTAHADGPPAEVMQAAWRTHQGMLGVPRDGWSELHVAAAGGGADRETAARLEGLKRRLATVLEPWHDG